MRILRLLSRVAFICNICYLLASLVQYLPHPPEGAALSSIIVLGWLMAIVVNVFVNCWLLVVGLLRKKVDVPVWLWVVNLLFLIVQLVILYINTHDPSHP